MTTRNVKVWIILSNGDQGVCSFQVKNGKTESAFLSNVGKLLKLFPCTVSGWQVA